MRASTGSSRQPAVTPSAREARPPASIEDRSRRSTAAAAASPSPAGPVLHRAIDLALAGALLVATAPILTVGALAVRLTSPGPVIFRQTRLGRDGRPFEMLKLRTMHPDADDRVHRAHVRRLIAQGRRAGAWAPLSRDARVTPVGRVLRRYCIDELPQLLNVLRGDMSLVGPRPAVPYEAEQWSDWQRSRLSVRPGLTGLWQIDGRGEADFETMVRMDLDYIARRSPWLDLQIVARTPMALLRRRHPA